MPTSNRSWGTLSELQSGQLNLGLDLADTRQSLDSQLASTPEGCAQIVARILGAQMAGSYAWLLWDVGLGKEDRQRLRC